MALRRGLAGVLLAVAAAAAGGCAEPGPAGPRDVLDAGDLGRAGGAAAAGTGTTVAVVDGGVDTDHPVLRDRVVAHWRAPDLPALSSAHGTQLAGIVGGRSTGQYSGGIAPGADLIDVKALTADGRGSAADLAAGLRFAHDARADVVLTSLALVADDPEVRRAVAALTTDGVLVVAASGNSFTGERVYPAAYPGVVSVVALSLDGHRLQLSGWGSAVLAAPGEDVPAPLPGGRFGTVSGTSAAAAVAAGLLAACEPPPRPGTALPAPWTDGTVTDGGRALPRLTCPGHDDERRR